MIAESAGKNKTTSAERSHWRLKGAADSLLLKCECQIRAAKFRLDLWQVSFQQRMKDERVLWPISE